jgi:hypothetical protein
MYACELFRFGKVFIICANMSRIISQLFCKSLFLDTFRSIREAKPRRYALRASVLILRRPILEWQLPQGNAEYYLLKPKF